MPRHADQNLASRTQRHLVIVATDLDRVPVKLILGSLRCAARALGHHADRQATGCCVDSAQARSLPLLGSVSGTSAMNSPRNGSSAARSAARISARRSTSPTELQQAVGVGVHPHAMLVVLAAVGDALGAVLGVQAGGRVDDQLTYAAGDVLCRGFSHGQAFLFESRRAFNSSTASPVPGAGFIGGVAPIAAANHGIVLSTVQPIPAGVSVPDIRAARMSAC